MSTVIIPVKYDKGVFKPLKKVKNIPKRIYVTLEYDTGENNNNFNIDSKDEIFKKLNEALKLEEQGKLNWNSFNTSYIEGINDLNFSKL